VSIWYLLLKRCQLNSNFWKDVSIRLQFSFFIKKWHAISIPSIIDLIRNIISILLTTDLIYFQLFTKFSPQFLLHGSPYNRFYIPILICLFYISVLISTSFFLDRTILYILTTLFLDRLPQYYVFRYVYFYSLQLLYINFLIYSFDSISSIISHKI